MDIREHELMQFEALGHFTEDNIEALARTSRRPPKPHRERHRDAHSTSELGGLALPLEHSCPRLA